MRQLTSSPSKDAGLLNKYSESALDSAIAGGHGDLAERYVQLQIFTHYHIPSLFLLWSATFQYSLILSISLLFFSFSFCILFSSSSSETMSRNYRNTTDKIIFIVFSSFRLRDSRSFKSPTFFPGLIVNCILGHSRILWNFFIWKIL